MADLVPAERTTVERIDPLEELAPGTMAGRPSRLLWRSIRGWIIPIVLVLTLPVPIILRVFWDGQIYTNIMLCCFAFLIGGVVGAVEIIARHGDEPFAALGEDASYLYLAINALAAAAAFWVIHMFGWEFDKFAQSDVGGYAIQVLVAGFGAMAVFRSSVFKSRVGDQEVEVGPAIILQTVLTAADSALGRQRAEIRAQRVEEIMRPVDAYKARKKLPEFCRDLLPGGLPRDQYEIMDIRIRELIPDEEKPVKVPDNSKAYHLGLILLKCVGPNVLKEAVRTLASEIQKPPPKLYLPESFRKEVGKTDGSKVTLDFRSEAKDGRGRPISARDALGRPIPITFRVREDQRRAIGLGTTTVEHELSEDYEFTVGETTVVNCEATDENTGLVAKGSFKITLSSKPDSWHVDQKENDRPMPEHNTSFR